MEGDNCTGLMLAKDVHITRLAEGVGFRWSSILEPPLPIDIENWRGSTLRVGTTSCG